MFDEERGGWEIRENRRNKSRLRYQYFHVDFAKILKTSILQNICEYKSYFSENIYHMKFLVTVFIAKKRLHWCLLNK